MLRWAWRGWWALALYAPLLPNGSLTNGHGGRLWLCVTSIIAILLGCISPPRRSGRLGLSVSLFCLVGLAQQAWWWSRQLDVLPLLYVQGAWWDTAGWWIVMVAGTSAAIRCAPRPTHLPTLLLTGLIVNLLAIGIEWSTGFSRWWQLDRAYAGLFPGQPAFAGWCAIAALYLWGWRWWAGVVALIGVAACPTSSALGALAAWAFVKRRPAWWHRPCLLMLASVVIYLLEPNFWGSIAARFETWRAVLSTIVSSPHGIGWGFRAYWTVAQHAARPILPHPASDWLMLPLRYGWWIGIGCCVGSVWLWTRRASVTINALRVAWFLAAWQTSLSLPSVFGLVWALWCDDRIGGVYVEKARAEGAGIPGRLSFAKHRT